MEESKDIVRSPIEITMSGNSFSGSQLNILYRGITQLDVDVETIEEDRIYPVTFNRSDLPRVNETENLKEDLEAIQGLRIEKIHGWWKNKKGDLEPKWESIMPFPKVGYEEGGIVRIYFLGEYVRELLQLKNGYAVFHILEMFKLQGRHPKKLFEIFSAYKNRQMKRYEVEVYTLKETLGISEKYKNRNQEFFNRIIKPGLKQINEKTSIEVKAAYTKSTKKKKGFYTFDVEHKIKDAVIDKKPDARQMTIEEGIAKEHAKNAEKTQELKHVKNKFQYFELNEVEQKRILENDRERQIFTAFCGRFKQDLGQTSKANMRGLYLKFLGFCKGKEFATYPEVMDRAKQFDERLANNSL